MNNAMVKTADRLSFPQERGKQGVSDFAINTLTGVTGFRAGQEVANHFHLGEQIPAAFEKSGEYLDAAIESTQNALSSIDIQIPTQIQNLITEGGEQVGALLDSLQNQIAPHLPEMPEAVNSAIDAIASGSTSLLEAAKSFMSENADLLANFGFGAAGGGLAVAALMIGKHLWRRRQKKKKQSVLIA